jgi:hypothetical protein
MMPRKKKSPSSSDALKRKFRTGPAGTCEAQLFEFSSESGPLAEGLDAEKTIVATHRAAACSMLEAAAYMAEHEPDFAIHSVRMIGLIVLLSGSEYN